jgi:hypothetical protein
MIAAAFSRQLFRGALVQRRFLSSSSAAGSPLFLWLTNDPIATQLLLPPVAFDLESNNSCVVTSAEDALEAVNDHYSSMEQFVGGMGESDAGVWLVGGGTKDALQSANAELVLTAIDLVQQERHGVPIGIYTSGLEQPDDDVMSSLDVVSSLQVSLFAANAKDYQRATGHDAFARVCGFIARAAEEGIAVEAAVLPDYAKPARDLALALGAQHVHVHDKWKQQ